MVENTKDCQETSPSEKYLIVSTACLAHVPPKRAADPRVHRVGMKVAKNSHSFAAGAAMKDSRNRGRKR